MSYRDTLLSKYCDVAIFCYATYLVIFREKAKKDLENVKSASHQVVPEIEHLLEDTFPTDIHDMGSHTVSVTHLDLEKKVRKNFNGEI